MLFHLDPGTYVAKPLKINYGETASKKTPFLRVQFIIEGGPYDQEPISYDGYLTEGAVGMTLRAVEACGANIKGKNLVELLSDVEQFEMIDGFGSTNVKLVVEAEYNPVIGQEVSRVRYVNPLSGPDQARLSGRSRALAALENFSKSSKKGGDGNGGAAAPPSSSA